MAAISMPLAARAEYAVHQLAKRKNWAQREPGVIVVLCIVFLVAILFIAMFINKKVRSLYPSLHYSNSMLTTRTEASRQGRRRIRYPSRFEEAGLEAVASLRRRVLRKRQESMTHDTKAIKLNVGTSDGASKLVYNVFEDARTTYYFTWAFFFCMQEWAAWICGPLSVRGNNEQIEIPQ